MTLDSIDIESLSTLVPKIFDQAQASIVTHKKNCIALYKLQNAAAGVTELLRKGKKDVNIRLSGEKTFSDIFLDMLNRVLTVKKGNPTADKVVKFVGTYLGYLNEKDKTTGYADSEETPSSRFISRLLRHLMKGLNARSKIVRYRTVSLISEVISHLGEMDQDLYGELRACLTERLRDKEPLIRAHCVAALSKIAASEDPDDLEDDEEPLLTLLLHSLFYDPAPEVRRAALTHISLTPITLPTLLTRCQDKDAVTRKLVYSTILPRLAHPKQLSIAQREQIVLHGLGDREDAVRLATGKLLGSWFDMCNGDPLSFLQLFDVRASEICTDALKSIFVSKADVMQGIEFNDTFWKELGPENALLARAFVEYCKTTNDQDRLESTLPVVTALAFHLQTLYNHFLDYLHEVESVQVSDQGNANAESVEEAMEDAEFVLNELLRLASHLDYADEIGRRKMFSVIRIMLAHAELPESLIKPCIEVLDIMSQSERDLVRVTVEVINELRDPGTSLVPLDDEVANESLLADIPKSNAKNGRGNRQFKPVVPNSRVEADRIDMRCLVIAISVLECVNSSFTENSALEGILADLVIPAVKRKELALREKGLVCLGLCCLIAKDMAMNSLQLFLSQVKSAPESSRVKVLQIVFDILMTYEKDILGKPEHIGQRVIAFIMQVLETEDSKAIQALICLGLSKLMLFGLVTDERVLTALVLAYVSPVTKDNQELRQCLAYFFPLYCYSSTVNQRRMQSIFITAYDLVHRVFEDMEEDQDMISPLQFGQLLFDWIDPTKLIEFQNAENADHLTTHVDLAVDLLKCLYDSDRSSEDKKIFCQLLGKIALCEMDEHKVCILFILIANVQELCPFEDSSTDKAFTRFKQRFEKRYASFVTKFDEEECFQDESCKEIFEFIGLVKPRKHKAHKNVPAVPASDSESNVEEAVNMEQRYSDSDDDESEIDEEETDRIPRPSYDEMNGLISVQNGRTRAAHDGEYQKSEVKENRQQPSTPQRKKTRKRVHTPSKTLSAASPKPKRHNTGRSAKARVPEPDKKPLANATNQYNKGTSREQTRRSMRSTAMQRKMLIDSDSETDGRHPIRAATDESNLSSVDSM